MQKYTQPVELIKVPFDFKLYDEAETLQYSESHVDSSATNAATSATTAAVISALHESRHPVVLRGIDIGDCKDWTPDYLKSVNGSKQVKIHRSKIAQLDFRSKNFSYETISFNELIEHCARDTADSTPNKDYLYLRSLGSDLRGRDVADISIQFPELFSDIKIPKLFPSSAFFSSVFRITSPNLQLWTHYDTCDNILVQVRGRKRIILFPPSEALNLYLDGDKSLVLNIDNPDLIFYPKFEKVQRFETILEEGDILFIPALWFHNVIALNFSISVNVFWKNLNNNLYDRKDTYGNRDLVPAQLGFRTLEKAVTHLQQLPNYYQDFYLRRMIISLQERLEGLSQQKEEDH